MPADSGKIPFTVRIGVTGHRAFTPEQTLRLRHQLDLALEKVRGLFPPTQDTRVVFTAVSALAEGADRLVAEAVLASEGGRLEVILPMHEKAYLEDFESEESRRHFQDLCTQASVLRTASEIAEEEEGTPEIRKRQYEWAGRCVAETCDVLLALWDGEASRGQGGTAEIIRYALEILVPVCYLPTRGGEMIVDHGDPTELVDHAFVATGFDERARRSTTGDPPVMQTRQSLRELDRYNRTPRVLWGSNPLAAHQFESQVLAEDMYLPVTRAGIDLRALADWVRPYYVWADRRAILFQRRYTRGIWVTFGAAAMAVSAAALGTIFGIGPWLFAVELILLSAIGLVVLGGRRFRLHDQWINSRFLAERFRSAVFLRVVRLGDHGGDGVESFGLQEPSADWLQRAYSYVWAARPPVEASGLEELRSLLAEGWIQPQITYHVAKSATNKKRESWSFRTSLALFALTFLVAVTHIVLALRRDVPQGGWEKWVSF